MADVLPLLILPRLCKYVKRFFSRRCILVQVCFSPLTAQNMAFVHFVGALRAPLCEVSVIVLYIDRCAILAHLLCHFGTSVVPHFGTSCPAPERSGGTAPRAGREGSPLGRDPPATAPPPRPELCKRCKALVPRAAAAATVDLGARVPPVRRWSTSGGRSVRCGRVLHLIASAMLVLVGGDRLALSANSPPGIVSGGEHLF